MMMMTTLSPPLFLVGCLLLTSNHLVHSWNSGAFPSSSRRPPPTRWSSSRQHSTTTTTTAAINTWQSFAGSRRSSKSITPITTSTTALWNSQWEKDIEASTRRRVQSGQAGSGTGETVAGAVLGGLLGGPFGALFGASIGSSLGGKNAVEKARKQELERLGITQEMLDSAQEIGVALERSLQGLKTVQESLDTQQRFARRLDAECNDLYDKAKNILASGNNNEDEARKLLLKRTQVQEQFKQALQNCALAKQQQATLEENARRLEQRAMEIDTLLRRASGAKAMQDTSALTQADSSSTDFGLSLRDSDPLVRKFKDMGIE